MSNADKNKQIGEISNQFAQIEGQLKKGKLDAETVGRIEYELKGVRTKISDFKAQFGYNEHVNQFENLADKLTSTLKNSAFNCI